ncbi:unnamed protein product [Ostreobium quekettii]|uniref:Uncharacterized protein n=1 Tax=Ostreobium quekettii TaxID=121088 RepID=A0A8S1J9M7_9CHLO|nr:unnamed protein product [Ostreobium quekettii]
MVHFTGGHVYASIHMPAASCEFQCDQSSSLTCKSCCKILPKFQRVMTLFAIVNSSACWPATILVSTGFRLVSTLIKGNLGNDGDCVYVMWGGSKVEPKSAAINQCTAHYSIHYGLHCDLLFSDFVRGEMRRSFYYEHVRDAAHNN